MRGDIAALLTRSAFAQGLGVIRNFVVLPILGPAQVGTFRLVQQLSLYSRHLSLGAFNTLFVKYSEWEGAGDTARCDTVHKLARDQSVLGLLVFPPIFIALAWNLHLSWPILIALAVAAGFPLLSEFVHVSYTVRGLFKDIARIDVVVSIFGLVALLVGAILWGLPGTLAAAFLPPILRVVLGRTFLRAQPERVPWHDTITHFRFGFRVWLGSMLTSVAMTIDLVLLGWLLADGSPLLGFYAVGLMVTQVLAQDLSAVTVVQQRALRREIGRVGGVTGEGIAAETRRLLGTDAFVGVCFAAATIAAAYVILPLVLPRFVGALPALGALLASMILIKARSYTRTILQNADRPRLAMIAPIAQLAFMAITYPLLVGDDRTMIELGLLRLAAFMLPAAIEVTIAYAIMARGWQGAIIAAHLVLGLVPAALGFIAIPELLGQGPLSTIGPAVAVLASYVVYNAVFDGAAREGMRMLAQIIRRALRIGRRQEAA